jgi:hypothetical protein
VRAPIESLAVTGQAVRVTAREPLRVEPRVLAVVAAIRVFERYPVFDRLTLSAGSVEISISRQEVNGLLGPDGFASLRERGRAREIVASAIRAYTAEPTT